MRNLIGKRLEEERIDLKKKKGEMAAIGGVVGSAYTNYLEGKRAPDAKFLAAIAAAGVDVQYILTGIRSINLAKKPETVEDHLKLVKATTEATLNSEETDERKMDLRDLLYAIEAGNNELIYDAIQRLSGKKILDNTIRPDQAALLDNIEHCPKEVQDAIKRLAFVSAKADKDKTQSGKKSA